MLDSVDPKLKEAEGLQKPHSAEALQFPKGVLSLLPDEVLEILYLKGSMCAYSNDKDIRKSFPVEDLPHLTHEKNELDRGCKALWEPHYNMVFLSNGLRYSRDDVNNDTIRYKVVAQSLLHETMHLIIEYLDPEEMIKLRKAVENIHEELKSSQHPALSKWLTTIDINTLREAMDYDSKLYNGRYEIGTDTRWVEVVCNTMGLMHTEYVNTNGDIPPANPFRDIASFKALTEAIDEASKKALVKAREKYSHIRVPRAVSHGGQEHS